MFEPVKLKVKVLEKKNDHLVCEIESGGGASIYQLPFSELWDEEDHPSVGEVGPVYVDSSWAFANGLSK